HVEVEESLNGSDFFKRFFFRNLTPFCASYFAIATMPLTKQYLRYDNDGAFNIIASNTCNLTFITYKGQIGRYIATAGGDDVLIWDLRTAAKVCTFPGNQVPLTCLAASPGDTLAAGYANGLIKVFDLLTDQCRCTLSGHSSTVTCLKFSSDGQLLASGSQDNSVLLWDVVAEKGKFRLAQHTNEVTQVCFMKTLNVLISCSKDKFVKFWDLSTGHCFKTLAAHNSEVWSMALRTEDKYLVTASNDYEVYIWQLLPLHGETGPVHNTIEIVVPTYPRPVNDDMDFNSILSVKKMGSLLRTTKGRCHITASDTSGHIATFNGRDSKVEVFYFNSEEEVEKKVQKRIQNKKKATGNKPVSTVHVTDTVVRCPVVKCNDVVKACHLIAGKNNEVRLVMLLKPNMVEMYSLERASKEVKILQALHQNGHRSHINSMSFSSDNLALATGSSDSVRVWNMFSRTCIRTFNTVAVKALCFTPGDRHLLIGGDKILVVLDITNLAIAEEIQAHESEIWSISVYPNQKGCITGSMDHTVKFWDFTLIDSKTNTRVLSLVHSRTLKLSEGVLSTCFSPNAKYLAISLTDNTVKILFFDSLKVFHTLYGHSLPVLCMDISYDSALICTGSSDRNIKIWGMDFGDCHKSIYGHDKSVASIKFVPQTHYFFSCGGDGLVNQWDADSFERIQTLKGHTGPILTLAVTNTYLASAGADKVLRFWKCTAEPLVLSDEREEERAQEEEAALATEPETIVPGQASHSLPSRKTVGAEKAAEELMEALELAVEYKETLQENQASGQADRLPNPPLLMLAMGITNPEEFVLATLKKIRASDMEEALLLLRFSAMEQLLKFIPMLIKLDPLNETVLIVYAFILKEKLGELVHTLKTLRPEDVHNVEEAVLQVS
ncbi:hypothetical protein B566_EDAN001153, partial [Ephemera danica]